MKKTLIIIIYSFLFSSYSYAEDKIESKDIVYSITELQTIKMRVNHTDKTFQIQKCSLLNKNDCVSSEEISTNRLNLFNSLFKKNLEKEFNNKYANKTYATIQSSVLLYGAGYLTYSKAKPNSRISIRGGAWWLVLAQCGWIAYKNVEAWKKSFYWNGNKKSLEALLSDYDDDNMGDLDKRVEDVTEVWESINEVLDETWIELIDSYRV